MPPPPSARAPCVVPSLVASEPSEPTPCGLDDFRAYFLVCSYDTLGNGNFRRHLVAQSAHNEKWALDLVTRSNVAASGMDRLQEYIEKMTQRPGLEAARTAIQCPQPPVTCVDGVDGTSLDLLWLGYRFEKAIQCVAVDWFATFRDGYDPSSTQSYADVAERMRKDTEPDALRLYQLYLKAWVCLLRMEKDAAEQELKASVGSDRATQKPAKRVRKTAQA